MSATGVRAMQVNVLGPVGVELEQSAALGGPTQRRVLALLALHAGEVVSVDRLVDAVWPNGDAPDRADHNVRTYVHRLRSALGDEGRRIETVGNGYRLHLEHRELDALRFEDLVAEGRAAAARDELPHAEPADPRCARAEARDRGSGARPLHPLDHLADRQRDRRRPEAPPHSGDDADDHADSDDRHQPDDLGSTNLDASGLRHHLIMPSADVPEEPCRLIVPTHDEVDDSTGFDCGYRR